MTTPAHPSVSPASVASTTPTRQSATHVGGAPRYGFESKPSSGLENWERTAQFWNTGLERTLERCRGLDAPWCHGKHGNTHALMVGAEISALSTMREVVGNRDDAAGRDGYLDGCFIGDTHVDLVEAKSSEAPLSADGRLPREKFERIQNLMRDAVADADRYFNRHGMFAEFHLPRRRIGVVFSSGWFTVEPSEISSAESWLANRLAQMRTVDHDFIAWSFPAAAHGLRYWNRHYPAVVVTRRLARTEPYGVMVKR